MKKGFTLVELIALIIIMGIIALVGMPTVKNVTEDSKKSTLKGNAILLAKAAEQQCMAEKMGHKEITNSYSIEDGKVDNDLEVESLPDSGVVSVTNKCKASVAIVTGKYCAIYDNGKVELNSNTINCSINYGEAPKTLESCFKFDEASKTITGYHFENTSCPTEISIPATINDIPVEHIGDFAFLNVEHDAIIYGSSRELVGKTVAIGTKESNIDAFLSQGFERGYIELIKYQDDSKIFCYDNDWDEYELPLNHIYNSEDTNKYQECVLYPTKDVEELGKITKVNFKTAVNLKTIGEGAFMYNKITSLNFENNESLESIGLSAFRNNQLSGTLDLSSLKLTKIKGFDYNNLTRVKLSNTITSIGACAFCSNQINDINLTNNLTEIEYTSLNDNKISGELKIPVNVESIGRGAFEDNSINSLILNDKIETITAESFAFNSNLSKVVLGKNIKNIERSGFVRNNISNIEFNDILNKIDYYAFGASTGTINNLVLPDSLEVLDERAFSDTKVNNVKIGNSLKSIGSKAFLNSKVRTITWGNSVESIETSAFQNCDLASLYIPNTVKYIRGGAFMYSAQNLDNNEFIIPDSVYSVDYSAFTRLGGQNLKTINTGNNVTSIGANAFKEINAPNLETLTTGGKIGTWAFLKLNSNKLKTINVNNKTTQIMDEAFKDMTIPYYATINLPSTISSISANAFTCTPASETDRKCDYTINVAKPLYENSNTPWGNTKATINWAS